MSDVKTLVKSSPTVRFRRIITVGIRGARDALLPSTYRARLACVAEVRLGEPIDAARYSRETREDLMHEVERRICELADIEPRGDAEHLAGDAPPVYGAAETTETAPHRGV